jgi:hypothetical protein
MSLLGMSSSEARKAKEWELMRHFRLSGHRPSAEAERGGTEEENPRSRNSSQEDVSLFVIKNIKSI